MDSLLTGWLHGCDRAPAEDRAAVDALIRARAADRLDEARVARLIAATGDALSATHGEGHPGIVGVRVADGGPGAAVEVVVASPAPSWLNEPASLEPLRARVDELDVDRRHGEGTCLRLRAFRPLPRPGVDIGLSGGPHPEEHVSGDGAFVVRRDGWVVLAVIDGLGHGPRAREEAIFAVEQLRNSTGTDPGELVAVCHRAFRGRRGAVMSVVSIEPVEGVVLHAGVGNVTTRVCSLDQGRGLAARPSFLGAPRIELPTTERVHLAEAELLLMFTDGLRRGTTLSGVPMAWRCHPADTAERLGRQRTGKDDHLVAVLRRR